MTPTQGLLVTSNCGIQKKVTAAESPVKKGVFKMVILQDMLDLSLKIQNAIVANKSLLWDSLLTIYKKTYPQS